MNGNDNPIPFGQGRISDDPLTEIARDGARRMLAAALTTEADDFVAALDFRNAQLNFWVTGCSSSPTTGLCSLRYLSMSRVRRGPGEDSLAAASLGSDILGIRLIPLSLQQQDIDFA